VLKTFDLDAEGFLEVLFTQKLFAEVTVCSFLERWTSLASGIIHILNHDSRSKKSRYWAGIDGKPLQQLLQLCERGLFTVVHIDRDDLLGVSSGK
jgi:hypothetical protein